MALDPLPPALTALGFTAAWIAAGVVSAASAADFVRYLAATPGKPPRFWRWAAFRDFVEERGPLTPAECWSGYQLGEGEADGNLGTAIMCVVLHQPACPPDVVAAAETSDRAAVRRAAARRRPSPRGDPPASSSSRAT